MNNSKTKFFLIFFTVIYLIVGNVTAQISRPTPELNVAGFEIGGDEKLMQALLSNYSPRYDNETNQPKYFFYNEYGNQVLVLTGFSKERPFLIVAIDVFAVGDTYQKKHFQLKDKAAFVSESGFFIGARPSATSLIFAIPNVTDTEEVIKKKGAPDRDEKDKKIRTLRYQFSEVEKLEEREKNIKNINFGAYTADFRFYKNKLSRLTISIAAEQTTLTKL